MKPIEFTRSTKRVSIRYLIPKGKHFARRFKMYLGKAKRIWLSMFPFMLSIGRFNSLRANFTIDPEVWHPNPDLNNKDWFDINKLFGINFGLSLKPHKDSYRIGIIPDYFNPGYFNLYLYIYRNGKRQFVDPSMPICQIQSSLKTEIILQSVAGNKLYVSVWMERAGMIYETSDVEFSQSSRWMSVLEPYHGGNLPAHSNWEIDFHSIELSYI